MLNLELLNQFLLVSMTLSIITTLFIQKTKRLFKNSKIVPIYGLIVNMLCGILFSMTFTELLFPQSLWIGFFSFIGAESIYRVLNQSLENQKDKDIENNDTFNQDADNIEII